MTRSELIAVPSRSGRLYRHSPLVLFAAGFISVVVFQQGCLAILNGLGLTPATPFPAAWSVEELNDACFVVRDANGQQLAYVYFEDEPGRRSAANCSLVTRRGESQ